MRVENKSVGAIEETGYLALVGITHEDGEAQLAKMADKTANLRFLMAKNPRLRLMRPFSPLVNSRSTEMRKKAGARHGRKRLRALSASRF